MLVDALEARNPNIGFAAMPGDLHVEFAWDMGVSEAIRARLTRHVGRPMSPEVRGEVRQDLEDFFNSIPGSTPVVPEVNMAADYAELERRVLSGTASAVSIGTAAHNALEEMYQVPEPPREDNPVSRRIRAALNEVVGGELHSRTSMLNNLYEQGRVSRRTLLLHLGLPETSTQEELNEAIRRETQAPPSPEPDRIRGRQQFNAILDDSAHFRATPETPLPQILGDTHLTEPPSVRQQAAIQHFQTIYGGDPVRSSEIEPPFQQTPTRRARPKRGPKPPEDRTHIPTRYNRKPVI